MQERPEIEELVDALRFATGALVALQAAHGVKDEEIIRFTGRWSELGAATVGEILDKTNDVLGRAEHA